jgi:hypothetical protein
MSEELSPDPDPYGWNRFEHAVAAALHTVTKHRESEGKGETKREPKSK